MSEERKGDVNQEEMTKFLIRSMNKGEDLPVAFNLNEPNPTDIKDFISTGSTLLNYLIANKRDGGIPMGKLTEIVGEEASGKSLLATQILANTQKKGGIAVYLDTENAANPDFMKRVGLDISRLVYMQPGSIEDCYGAIEKTILMARAKNTTCPVTIVWDSTAATPAQAEIEGDYNPNSRIGLAGKAHAKGLRKITHMVGVEKITLIFCNQLKVKIGVLYGDPMTTPGGKAVPYHASVRIRLTKSKAIDETKKAKDSDKKLKETTGFHTYAKVFKSRLGPPMRKCEFDILFTHGIDDVNSIRDYLWEKRGVITKSAGYMKMMDHKGEEKKFRANDWSKMMEDDDFSGYVYDLLEKLLVIKYDDEDIPDAEIDADSCLEMESAVEGNV